MTGKKELCREKNQYQIRYGPVLPGGGFLALFILLLAVGPDFLPVGAGVPPEFSGTAKKRRAVPRGCPSFVSVRIDEAPYCYRIVT